MKKDLTVGKMWFLANEYLFSTLKNLSLYQKIIRSMHFSKWKVWLFFAFTLSCAGCVSVRTAEISQGKGAFIGVFWFSGLNGDQASNAMTRELLQAGFNVVDTAEFNQTMHRLGINPSQMNRDALRKLHSETGASYLLVGSSVPLPGIFDFSHAGMSAHLVNLEDASILWSETYGNSVWTGVFGTSNDVNRGAFKLVQSLDAGWGGFIKAQAPKSTKRS